MKARNVRYRYEAEVGILREVLPGLYRLAIVGNIVSASFAAGTKINPRRKEIAMAFLKRRFSVAVWELILLLVVAIIFATVYRIYFSRAVALTQICEKFAAMQSGEAMDMFKADASDSLNDINRLCQLRRPRRQ
jgi:hypothetical protein